MIIAVVLVYSSQKRNYTMSTTRSKLASLLTRHSLLIAVICLVGIWTWQALTPQQLFATEEERVKFLTSIGMSPSIRIITLVTEWCPACKGLEHQLTEKHIPHLVLDVEHSAVGSDLFRKVYAVTKTNAIPQIILDKDIVGRSRLFLELAKSPGKELKE